MYIRKFLTPFTILLLVCIFYQAKPVMGHGGGLDKNGCHHNRKTGGYHCHRGPKQEFKDNNLQKRHKASDHTLFGRASVLDGDTIRIGKTRVRLHGIDAPETRQKCLENGQVWRCGELATQALKGIVDGRPVLCLERDTDRYGRVVAVCRAGALNLNAWMVRQGYALAYRRYSNEYVQDEIDAQLSRRGMWRGDFIRPWEWRRGRR